MRKDPLIFIAGEKNFQRSNHPKLLVGHAVHINLSYGQQHKEDSFIDLERSLQKRRKVYHASRCQV